jgi:GNAT superfamily N-acetyltransferase
MGHILTIRKAGWNDLPVVHQLVRELAIYEKAEHEFIASLEDYQNGFKEQAFFVLLADVDTEVAGMALYYYTYSTWKGKMMYLEDFIVKQEYRKQGIGTELFAAFLEDSKLKNCKLVKWQVLDWNEPALRFYEKQKAIIEKEWWNGKILFSY